MSSSQRMEDVNVTPAGPARRTEEGTGGGGGKRKTILLQEGDAVPGGEGTSAAARKMETPAPKARRKKGDAGTEDGGEGRRRRKPKPIVEVNSTFTELRRLLQDMRPSTLQVLRTPYFRNCKAARNMRKGVRQIRDFCKQVRLETVMLAKKKQGDEMPTKKKKKPDAATPDRSKIGPDLEPGSPSHSTDVPTVSHSTENRIGVPPREPSESSEPPKPRIFGPKSDVSAAHKERDRAKSPKRERDRDKSPRRERERDRSPKREREREREKSWEREKSPRRERERERSPKREIDREWGREKSPKREIEREWDRERSPKWERESSREMSPKAIQKKPKLEMEDMLANSEESE